MMGPVNTTSQQRDGLCIETTVDYTEARSPAFVLDGKAVTWYIGCSITYHLSLRSLFWTATRIVRPLIKPIFYAIP